MSDQKLENTPVPSNQTTSFDEKEIVPELQVDSAEENLIELTKNSKTKRSTVETKINFFTKELIGIYINFLMLAVTFAALYFAISESNSSDNQVKKALEFAEKAIRVSENNYVISKKNFDSSIINFQKSYQVTKKFTEEAIKSFEVSKNQFELTKASIQKSDSNFIKNLGVAAMGINIAATTLQKSEENFATLNRSYVITTGVSGMPTLESKPDIAIVTIENIGKLPALIIANASQIRWDTSINPIFIYNEKDVYPVNLFITNRTETIAFEIPKLSKEGFQQFQKNSLFLYVYGQILFQDIALKKFYSYPYGFRIRPNNRVEIGPVTHQITEVKDPSKWMIKLK